MTNKRLTDNQIVMLMERCYKKEESIVVTQFNSDDTKTEITVDDILGIIYRQNAEIKTLQERNVILRGAVDSQKAEIEKLQADKEALIAGQETLQKALATAKAEAIKEFAEQLKSRTHEISCNVLQVVTKADIDNLAKEMVGE